MKARMEGGRKCGKKGRVKVIPRLLRHRGCRSPRPFRPPRPSARSIPPPHRAPGLRTPSASHVRRQKRQPKQPTPRTQDRRHRTPLQAITAYSHDNPGQPSRTLPEGPDPPPLPRRSERAPMRVPGTQDHRRPEGLALPTEARLVPGPSGGAERTTAAYELVKEKLIKSANYKPREYAGFCSLSDSLQRWRSTRMHLRRDGKEETRASRAGRRGPTYSTQAAKNKCLSVSLQCPHASYVRRCLSRPWQRPSLKNGVTK